VVVAPSDSCAASRATAQRVADSVLAIPTALWRPSLPADSLLDRARRSGVVAQVLLDTAGAPVMRTFRVLAADWPQYGEAAARILETLRFPPREAEGGCRVPFVVVLPFEFRRQ
jgi:hypothetical protein